MRRPARFFHCATFLTVTVLGLLLQWIAPPIGGASPTAFVFRSVGPDGGGFINVVAIDPSGSGLVLAGADLGGIQRSTDFGENWTPANTGISGVDRLTIASIVFAADVPGETYAAVGYEGADGGLLVSVDGGLSWSLRSTVPEFSGSANQHEPIPHLNPRSTGALLAVDASRGLLYAATFRDGVMRSADDGFTWTTLGLAGQFLRSIAIDPVDPDVVYASAWGGHVFKTATASTTGAFTKLASSPATVEELLPLDGDLYAAAGTAGVFRSSDDGASWVALGAASLGTGATWTSIDGYRACGQTVLYAGSADGGSRSLVRSTDGGDTWMGLTGPASVHLEVGGSGGPTWWLSQQPNVMLGGSSYLAAQIAIDPTPLPPDQCLQARILVAGRSGVWGTQDAGDDWYPDVHGIAATLVRSVATLPGASQRIWVGLADWRFMHSEDGGASFSENSPGTGGAGFDVAVDRSTPTPSAYLAVGNSGGNVPKLYSSANPGTVGWVDHKLPSAANGGRALAVLAGQAGSSHVIVAAVEGSGIWRKAGSKWTKVNATAMAGSQTTNSASFAWIPGTSTMYLFDHRTGIWRSTNAGLKWSPVWQFRTIVQFSGDIAIDPTNPTRLYASVGDVGVYRLDNANAGTVGGGQITPVLIGTLPHPGPLAVDAGGALYVTELADGGPPDLQRTTDGGATWASVADNAYRATAMYPCSLNVADDGTITLGLAGDGIVRGVPAP